jgi:RNA methyltransferase, TrmH family
MPVREIESRQNARLKQLRKALAAPGRSADKLVGRASLVGIEGPHLLEEALRAGLRVATVFVAQSPDHRMDRLRLPATTEVLKLPRKLLDSVLATDTPQSVAALVQPPDWTWAHLLGGAKVAPLKTAPQKTAPLILVLAGIQDPGNLGTILRSAEAFGASGVVSLPGTVSAWNPKAVRGSAGSIFRVPVIAAREQEAFQKLSEAGVHILATTAHAARAADLVDLAGPIALVIGNEGNGVADGLIAKADAKVTIPCPGPVESLNAAVAASVLLYEAARQRAIPMSKHSSKGAPRTAVPHAVGARR